MFRKWPARVEVSGRRSLGEAQWFRRIRLRLLRRRLLRIVTFPNLNRLRKAVIIPPPRWWIQLQDRRQRHRTQMLPQIIPPTTPRRSLRRQRGKLPPDQNRLLQQQNVVPPRYPGEPMAHKCRCTNLTMSRRRFTRVLSAVESLERRPTGV